MANTKGQIGPHDGPPRYAKAEQALEAFRHLGKLREECEAADADEEKARDKYRAARRHREECYAKLHTAIKEECVPNLFSNGTK